ncbi:MAG: Cna B-type domain-containing protein [Clostridia bacterium]|nr:Cna B-type domain-containing protein [Clostridia bacterium]MBR5767549.1 Cna B-type domain-containing protein [Clostridia bacterium]
MKEGVTIVYSIAEIGEIVGYTTAYSGEANSFTITNTHEPEKTRVDGVKNWVGDKEHQRPDFITVRLYADGEEIRVINVTAETDWTFSFTGLDKYKDGVEIVYTISEDPVEGYTTLIEGTTIKNTPDNPGTGDPIVASAAGIIIASLSGIALIAKKKKKSDD